MNIPAPISAGELIDKITILRIKRDKIRDDAGQQHIRRELEELLQVRTRSGLDSSLLVAPEEQLLEINLRLWEIEDELRESERTSQFGARFVELARLVYTLNDRRAALKRDINARTGSAIVEQKSYPSY